MVKRLSLIFITICFLSTSLVSCTEKKNDEIVAITDNSAFADTTGVTNATEEVISPDLPERDFEGYNFKILHWEYSDWDKNNDLYAEQQTGEAINDAVYQRNSFIEDKYNIKISLTYEDIAKIGDTVRKMVQAEDNSYDLVYPRLYEAPALITSGLLYDLHELEYVDFSKPWWDKKSVEGLSVGGKLYLAASDINIMDKNATEVILFNKKLIRDLSLSDPYELVKKGEWTLDSLIDLSKNVSKDLNGDSIYDENDLFGILGSDEITFAFLHGGGGRYAEKDKNDLPVITFDNERTISLCEKIMDILYDKTAFFNRHLSKSVDNIYINEQLFSQNQGLFMTALLGSVSKLKDMETEFGILPVPKYDKQQEEYGCSVSIHATGLLGVPVSAPDPERTGIIIEALSAQSMYTLMPAYYDVTLKRKYIRDEESKEMLDIILKSRVYDLGEVFSFGQFSSAFLRISATGSDNIVSLFEKHKGAMQKDIDKLIDQVGEIN